MLEEVPVTLDPLEVPGLVVLKENLADLSLAETELLDKKEILDATETLAVR